MYTKCAKFLLSADSSLIASCGSTESVVCTCRETLTYSYSNTSTSLSQLRFNSESFICSSHFPFSKVCEGSELNVECPTVVLEGRKEGRKDGGEAFCVGAWGQPRSMVLVQNDRHAWESWSQGYSDGSCECGHQPCECRWCALLWPIQQTPLRHTWIPRGFGEGRSAFHLSFGSILWKQWTETIMKSELSICDGKRDHTGWGYPDAVQSHERPNLLGLNLERKK